MKRENWWIYLILSILTLGIFTFYVGYKLKVYESNQWYSNKYYWILGFLLGVLPGLVMFLIFLIQIGCTVSLKLNVTGKEIYMYPYPWLICLIVPVLGWTLFIIMYIYTHLWYVFSIRDSYGK